MMNDEEVKKALEACTTLRYKVGGCKQCPYEDDCNNGTQNQLYADALALINRLEDENKKLSDKNKELRALCREKSNGMKLDKWVRMLQEADYGIKFVDNAYLEREKEQIRKETAIALIEELEYYSSYENTDLKGGISCLKQYVHEKYSIEVE